MPPTILNLCLRNVALGKNKKNIELILKACPQLENLDIGN